MVKSNTITIEVEEKPVTPQPKEIDKKLLAAILGGAAIGGVVLAKKKK